MPVVQDLQGWSRRQNAPVTIAVIASLVATALLFWFTRGKSMQQFMIGWDSHARPWSFLTYAWMNEPFGGGLSLMFFVFLLMWFYSFGTVVERDLGMRSYLVLWFVSTLVTGVFLWLGMQVLHVDGIFGGAYLPVSAVTMVWCARYPNTSIMLYGIVPVPGRWLAVIDVVIVVLLYGNGLPLLGVFAAAPLALAYLYGLGKLPFRYQARVEEKQATRAQARYGEKYYDDVKKREQEREEKERLRKLFEGSLDDEK
jgi:hypothetical protein